MKVEIWSDIMCPFCYIGKKNFEKAVQELPFKDQIEIEWKSFQLDPTLDSSETMTTNEYFRNKKGVSVEQAKQMTAQVAVMGKASGIDFNFENAFITNTYKAHQLLHLAKKYSKTNEVKEELFKAHFIEGKNVGNDNVLTEIAQSVGISDTDIQNCLQNNEFENDIQVDIKQAKDNRISGVPFFILDGKYGISGAQPAEFFVNALTQTYNESEIYEENTGTLTCGDDESCSI